MSNSNAKSYYGAGQGLGHGGGRGRNNGGGFGTGGYCICSKCGEKVLHETGIKCTAVKCPKCGHSMVREELLHKQRNYSEKKPELKLIPGQVR